jgi:methionyl-tRNA formyltransferase
MSTPCDLRIVFLGIRDFALPGLRVLVQRKYSVVGVVTTFKSRSSRRVVRVIIRKVVQGPDTVDAEEPGTIIGSVRGTIQVQTGRATSVIVGQFQPADKRMMTPAEFQNGYHVARGDRFRAPAEALAQRATDQDVGRRPRLLPVSAGMFTL